MSTYCFAENKRALFAEACLRGAWQAYVDFPKEVDQKSVAVCWSLPDELRAEVCCITDEFAYRALIAFAWGTGYNATERATSSERERFVMATTLKGMSRDEGIVMLRHVLSCSQNGQAFIEKAYAQLAALPLLKEHNDLNV